MLLPALNAAKKSAVSTQCINNLKQVAYIVQMYADDWSDAIPATQINPYNNAFVLYRTTGYVKKNDLFVCPGFTPNKYDNDDGHIYGTHSHGFGNTKSFFRSFSYQASVLPPTSNGLLYADTIAGQPASTQMMNYFWQNTNSTTAHSIHLRHARKANIQHIDGSVGTYGAQDIAKRYRFFYNTVGPGANSGYSPNVRYYYQIVTQ